MSGGSWDYAFSSIQDVAYKLQDEKDVARRALGEHMTLVTKAMYDIEWVDSGDKSPGDEIESINAVLGDSAETKQIEILLKDASNIINQLNELGVK